MEYRQKREGTISVLSSGFRLRDTIHVESHTTGKPTSPEKLLAPQLMNRQDCANSGIARIYVNCIQIWPPNNFGDREQRRLGDPH
jgi:hypothetical protein